jgi:membrane-bound ClpP family serine protease
MVGLKGVAQETFVVQGTILVRGEIWKATSRQGIIQRGESVRVTAMSQGLLLEVEKVDR